MPRIVTISAALSAVFLTIMPDQASAASIMKSNDPECRVDLQGPIGPGDSDRLRALEDHLVIDSGESTSQSVMCLDSPGGSVTEGIEIARFVLEKGVSTRLRSGAECASVCAIIFMMGNYRGSEVSGISREMEIDASLGFHRPYMSMAEAGLYTSNDVEGAYDLGIGTTYELIELANARQPWGTGRMIEADLIQVMTATPGDSMHWIKTVEEALRWKITINGIEAPRQVAGPHLNFACENALAADVALATELSDGDGLMSNDIFRLKPLQEYSVRHVVEENEPVAEGRYTVASLRAGYSGVGCQVSPGDDYVRVCGYDESTDHRVGNCDVSNDMRGWPALAFYHPSSSLLAIGWGSVDAPASTLNRCKVISPDGETLDDQVCIQATSLISEEGYSAALHEISWPSGAKTVVEIETEGYQRPNPPRAWVNGAEGIISSSSNCIFNEETRNSLCLSGPM